MTSVGMFTQSMILGSTSCHRRSECIRRGKIQRHLDAEVMEAAQRTFISHFFQPGDIAIKFLQYF